MEKMVKYYLKKNSLRFPAELERKFSADYFQRILPIVRIALVLAFLLYSCFGILDAVISPETKYFTWLIRYAIVCPLIFIVFVLSFYRIFEKILQLSISVVSLVAGFGIIFMIVTARSVEGSLYYYAGLILIIMWSYTFVRLRFIHATIVCGIIIVGYELSVIFFWDIFSTRSLMIAFINNNFFMISSNILGMFVCYDLEISMRRDFLQRYLISEHEKRAKKEKKMLVKYSRTDPLTSAYNRRYFMDMLDSEISRANRSKNSFSIIMLDIDHFKEVNDKYGHDEGDIVLKGIVSMMRKRIRNNDVLARWGGEEFMILLAMTNLDNAKIFTDMLIAELRNLVFEKSGKITASFGVTEYRLSENMDSLLKRVDELVYKAKSEGRDCMRFSI
jgi:diguanylate cyclase (GGDEF)-like protein